MATTTQTLKTKSAAPAGGLVAAAVLAVAGVAAWIYQMTQGMQVTGLGQQVVWGLYIAAFFTAVGAGAALLGLVGVSEFRPVLPLAVRSRALALALGAFAAGGLLITMDVGNPLQLWRLITGFRFSSMMVWDFWLLLAAGVVALAYLLAAKSGRPQKALGALGILAGVAVVAVEGWMLSLNAARPMWGGGLPVVSFLVGAALAAAGLAVIALPNPDRLLPVLGAGLVLSLVLVLAEVLTGLLGGSQEMSLLLAGFAAPFFWLQLLAGLVLPLALVLMDRSLPLAGGLSLLGVLAEKVWMLAAGQAEPWLALPEGSYFPSWVELAAVVGAFAIGWLVYQGVLLVSKDAEEPVKRAKRK